MSDPPFQARKMLHDTLQRCTNPFPPSLSFLSLAHTHYVAHTRAHAHCCEATYIQMAAGNEVTSSKAKGEVGKREGVDTVVKQHIFK